MAVQAAALYALVGVTGAQQSIRDLQGVSNQVSKTQGVMSGLGKGAGQMATGVQQVGKGLLRIGEWATLAAGAAVAASAKMGTSFQAQTELIHTQANASQDEVDRMRVAIQAMAHEVGTAPVELAKAVYHIESVGVRGADALDVLKAAALGAKLGLADVESVANALTAIKFSGIGGVKDMIGAMATLDAIIGQGNMRMQDLVDSFSTGILGTAKTFGIGLREVGAALAVLTDAGVPAQIAATRIQMGFTHMAAPIPGAVKVLKHLGMTQFEMAADLRKPDGIFVALEDLRTHLEKAKEGYMGLDSAGKPAFITTPQGAADVSKLFGGSRFGAAILQLLGMTDRIKLKFDAIGNSQATFGEKVQATMRTAGFVWGQFRADIDEAALAFSDGFLPALARAGMKLDAFLYGHTADIRQLGVQLGQWLDKIDWQQVEKGANDFIGVLKSALDLVSKIPPQVDAAVVGFLALNKLSGGLLGAGVGNIVGGAAKGLESVAAGILRGLVVKIPGIGGAIASVTAVHVFVDNWPAGFGVPGGGGGIPGLPLLAAGGALPVVLVAGTIAAIGAAFLFAINQKPDWVPGHEFDRGHGYGPPGTHGITGPLTGPAGNVTPQDLASLYTPFDLGKVGNLTPQISRMTGEVSTLGGSLTAGLKAVADASLVGSRVLDRVHQDFVDAIRALRKPDQTPAEIRKMAKQLVDATLKGVGSAQHTKEAIDLLRSKLTGADPETARAIRAAIASLEQKLHNRTLVSGLLAKADASLRKNVSVDAHVRDLTSIQRTLLRNGDTHAAAKITAEIRAEKAKIVSATHAASREQIAAIKDKDLSLTLNQTLKWIIDGRDLAATVIRQSEFDRSSAGPGR